MASLDSNTVADSDDVTSQTKQIRKEVSQPVASEGGLPYSKAEVEQQS